MKKSVRNFTAALSVFALAACATDNPTDVGGPLLSTGDLVTFEVNLPASAFIAFDSAFSGYSTAFNAGFGAVANKWDGTTDANTLMRFSQPPTLFSIRTTGTTVVVDSAPRFYTAKLVLHFDTTVIPLARGTRLALYQSAQEWNESATWTNRIDTLGTKLAWTTPGGTRGARIDTVTWVAGDSAMMTVDSATLALWTDSTNKARGALLVSETPGSIVHVTGTALHVSAHSRLNADTVIAVDLVPSIRTYLSNPVLATPSTSIRVGGTPAWRTVFRLRDDLSGSTYPCTTVASTCTVKLDSAHLSVAQLVLKPVRPPAGFLPEDTLLLEARTVSPTATVPLSRAPLGMHIGYSGVLSPNLFAAPADSVVKIDVTTLLRHLTNPDVKDADRLPPYLALLQVPESQTLGLAAFGATPVLRLVLTANVERRP